MKPFAGLKLSIVLFLLGIASPQVTWGSSILFIGDSHTMEDYGDRLHSYFQTTGAKVRSLSLSGFTARHFLIHYPAFQGVVHRTSEGSEHFKLISHPNHWSFQLEDYLSPSPDLTVVSMGANDVDNYQQNTASTKRYALDLMNKIKATGSKCLWIGPHYKVSQDALLEAHSKAIEEAARVAGCGFIRSYDLSEISHPRANEHYGRDGALRWAKAVWGKIQKDSYLRGLFPGKIEESHAETTFVSLPHHQTPGIKSINLNGLKFVQLSLSNGKIVFWSQISSKKYPNCTLNESGPHRGDCELEDPDESSTLKAHQVVDSPAALACKNFGQLPTRNDYADLFRNFEKDASGFLSEASIQELNDLFPGFKENWFWTSSLGPTYTDYAYSMNGEDGNLNHFPHRHEKAPVLCIRR